MVTTFMTVAGWVFWVGVAIVFLFAVLTQTFGDDDDYSTHAWGTGVTMGALLFALLFTDAFVGVNLIWFFVLILAYFGVGGGWAIKKWVDLVDSKLDYYKRLWAEAQPSTKFGEASVVPLDVYLKDKKPIASQYKARITSWMALWPLSLTWWVLTYPRRFFVWLHGRLSTVLDRITDNRWK